MREGSKDVNFCLQLPYLLKFFFTMREARNSLLPYLACMKVKMDGINIHYKDFVRHQEPMNVGSPIQTSMNVSSYTHTPLLLPSNTY